MNETLAVILGGGAGTRLFPLTSDRAKPAVPLAGKFRLVDVPISNCINSGLYRIFVLTQYNSASLNNHIARSYVFDRVRGGFVTLLAAEESAVFHARSPVFEVEPGAPGVSVVGRYPGEDLLLSGYAQGEEEVAGRAALVEARVGRGRVIMFGFRPQHRAQTHETFKLLFNALYLR